MKIIITETQKEKIQVLRRIDSDWKWIIEIVDEGLELDDPLHFRNLDDYVIKVTNDSSQTYLLNYIDDWKGETFEFLKNYVAELIEEKLYLRIKKHYNKVTRSYDPSDL